MDNQHHMCPTCGQSMPVQYQLYSNSLIGYTHVESMQNCLSIVCVCVSDTKSFAAPQSHVANMLPPLTVCTNNAYELSFLPSSPPLSTPSTPTEPMLSISSNELKHPSPPITAFVEHIKPVKCPHEGCTKAFAKTTHLRAHMRTHSGVRMFICTWPNCKWRFARSDELTRHTRRHTGERPYKCQFCTKEYARSDHLKLHIKQHHS